MLCRQSRCVRQVPAEQRVKGGEDKGESDESRADLPHPLGQPKVLVKSLTFIEDSPCIRHYVKTFKNLVSSNSQPTSWLGTIIVPYRCLADILRGDTAGDWHS